MSIDDIKQEAALFKAKTDADLNAKIAELKERGEGFLACVAFIQHNQNISLADAKNYLLSTEAWQSEKDKTINSLSIMFSEFEED